MSAKMKVNTNTITNPNANTNTPTMHTNWRLVTSALTAVILFLFSVQTSFAFTVEEAAKINTLLDEGRKSLAENKPDDAIPKLREALKLAPDSPVILVNLGFALESAGQYDEALIRLKESIKLDPSIPMAWVNLAGVYQCTARIPEAIETFETYLKRFPKDAHVSQVKPILAILKNTKLQNASSTDAANHSDYYVSAVHDGVRKWDAQMFPLKVFISKGDPAKNYKESFSKQIENALNVWQTSSNNVVSFVLVNDAAAADIEVRWTNDENAVSTKGEAGDCRTRLGAKGITHAIIMILISDGNEALPLGDPFVHWVGLHELGHALGLGGHSVSPNDIMYATMTFDYYEKTITPRDVATLAHLYQTDVKVTGSPNQLYNEATAELNKQTLAANGERNFLPVITKFETIRKDFPTFEQAKAPLAQAYSNHATLFYMTGKLAEAAVFYKKALATFTKINKPGDQATVRKYYSDVLKQLNRNADAAAVLAGKNP
ncbi:MAG: tetratricopeptide repeat protein [Candidatus Melainabacteria bacterium]|nr:tetratricopeptide repeat protein [Candidatus Melainabacteria bacterium]